MLGMTGVDAEIEPTALQMLKGKSKSQLVIGYADQLIFSRMNGLEAYRPLEYGGEMQSLADIQSLASLAAFRSNKTHDRLLSLHAAARIGVEKYPAKFKTEVKQTIDVREWLLPPKTEEKVTQKITLLS